MKGSQRQWGVIGSVTQCYRGVPYIVRFGEGSVAGEKLWSVFTDSKRWCAYSFGFSKEDAEQRFKEMVDMRLSRLKEPRKRPIADFFRKLLK